MKSNDRKKHVVITHEGIAHARQLLKARKGPPSEADRPRRPSRPPRVLPGQVDIHATTHGLDEDADEQQEGAAA